MENRRAARAARRQGRGAAELNITPFLNLMVVLVPFLLSGVVFSRLAVLEMRFPNSQNKTMVEQREKAPFRLIVTLRADRITVSGDGFEQTEFSFSDSKYDLSALSSFLEKIKNEYPHEESVSLLSEPNIPYESVIAVMDACREMPGKMLFPDISIGEIQVLPL